MKKRLKKIILGTAFTIVLGVWCGMAGSVKASEMQEMPDVVNFTEEDMEYFGTERDTGRKRCDGTDLSGGPLSNEDGAFNGV